ncbi:MAG TPA: hypothetical protein VFX61_10810 [Micromonosporaceae bacterium]|nr:hypothetical protein [Micromonosporaceae bacterium]
MSAAPSAPAPDFDPAAAYPEVKALRAALAARNWAGVRAVCDRAQPSARTRLVQFGSDDPEVEGLLREVLARDPDDTLAASMLGSLVTKTGWAVRTGARAKDVTREQFRIFHQMLRQAEQILIDAAARNPADPSVWVNRLTTARGLQLGLSEVRRRYNRLAMYDPHHLPGQSQLLQSLCPKWSGTWEQVHGFAQECMLSAPAGSHNAVLVVVGHLERWLELDYGPDEQYLRSQAVRDEIYEAARRSVWHPEFRRDLGWVWVRNTFAMIFSVMGEAAAAANEFAALGNLATEDPWHYLGDNPAQEFQQAQMRALAKGAAR